jgi:hypothetical protein
MIVMMMVMVMMMIMIVTSCASLCLMRAPEMAEGDNSVEGSNREAYIASNSGHCVRAASVGRGGV